ncbi:hypothetical protein [Haloarchaeobius iranensis]|uniref:FaeA-like protein n=1 Tax=Haloarchaeobius iranensis TaxID=996166 RepID=A0A1H0B8E9_9EURY|nr:hypothetical protein [Haloarchaeobius iranensis]SDN41862.1 hypothetical protein SAMN05192554_1358 [Haloarchaeobius iranensis]
MAGRKETVSDSEILNFFAESDDPVLTTSEVADAFDFSNEGMRKRLYSLVDESALDYKKAGRSPVWWLTEAGRESLNEPEEPRDQS